ncbi:MAG: hypothetical protein M1834_005900 [Cirrosporium novae-zelandiae]|nr:MAG: hypothetical protein M1834_005900 [Cirrosporium novae-zelandiae]
MASEKKIEAMRDMNGGTPSEPPPSYEAVAQPAPFPGKRPIARPLDIPALAALKGKRVILASQSPRRRQLLAQIGLVNLEIIPSAAAEDFPKSLAPFEYVIQTAQKKAMTVYKQEIDNEEKGEPALILAADTVVVSGKGELLEKPRSEKEHIAMLKGLRDGGDHKVFTAVTAIVPLESARDPGYALETTWEETVVKFDKEVSDQLIMAYVKTREGADKAGGYGIQGMGTLLVSKIDGGFDNVVGLPLRATLKIIERVMSQDNDIEDELEGTTSDNE